MGAKQTSECGSCHQSHSAAIPKEDRRDQVRAPRLRERRENAVKPHLETRRKLSSEESAGGHRVEKSRMIWETRGYTGDRAGVILEVQVRQLVDIQQVYPALPSFSFQWFYTRS